MSASRRRPGVLEVLRLDAGLLAAAWLARAPDRRAEIEATLRSRNIELPRRPSTQFVLTWETDANDGQGPMGYGMGTLQIIEHDGHGQLRIDERPFVIMHAGARVPLGTLER